MIQMKRFGKQRKKIQVFVSGIFFFLPVSFVFYKSVLSVFNPVNNYFWTALMAKIILSILLAVSASGQNQMVYFPSHYHI